MWTRTWQMACREEDIPEVREESFRYSGPRPQTREAAIISLADSIESASRNCARVISPLRRRSRASRRSGETRGRR